MKYKKEREYLSEMFYRYCLGADSQTVGKFGETGQEVANDVMDAFKNEKQSSQKKQMSIDYDIATLICSMLRLTERVENIQGAVDELLKRFDEEDNKTNLLRQKIKKLRKSFKELEKSTRRNEEKLSKQKKASKIQAQELSEQRSAIQAVGWSIGVCNMDVPPKRMKKEIMRNMSCYRKEVGYRRFGIPDKAIDATFREVK